MKKQIFKCLAKVTAQFSQFTASASAGTASQLGVYQPKVPKSLLK
ncbi:MAG: cyclic lactone autoinducer peptide [Clostridiales bacterium]|nr:cyclic lactone autoinducer peptide [Clostridiales bacterium]